MANKGIGVGECTQHGEYYLDAADSPCPSCEEAQRWGLQNPNTGANRERLASFIVEGWDLTTLMEYAVSTLESHYKYDNESFQEDWDQELGEGA